MRTHPRGLNRKWLERVTIRRARHRERFSRNSRLYTLRTGA